MGNQEWCMSCSTLLWLTCQEMSFPPCLQTIIWKLPLEALKQWNPLRFMILKLSSTVHQLPPNWRNSWRLCPSREPEANQAIMLVHDSLSSPLIGLDHFMMRGLQQSNQIYFCAIIFLWFCQKPQWEIKMTDKCPQPSWIPILTWWL